jgi:GntR family transcriptional regulator/MocR family aminotransferase
LLGLSRNTVTAAYEQLVDEAFLEARPRSGVFVAKGARSAMALPLPHSDGKPRPPDWRTRVRRSLAEQRTLAKPEGWRDIPFPFVYGSFDPELFPTDDFRECCVQTLTRAQTPNWTVDFEAEDLPDLVEQIRRRVLPKRGVFALKEEILITVGAHQACHLLADALFDTGTRLGFEEPGHPHARNTFALRQPRWSSLPLDGQGLIVDGLPSLDYLFVTPSHQSPTTVTLPLQRRQQLLQHAEAQDLVIIEDDYEAENLYAGTPMPALKSLDKSGRVIYIGSLAKSLAPALRLGYIVAPRALVAELRLLRHAMVRHPSAFLQQAYALFISLGHHESHARRVNQVMQERLALAAAALARHLPEFEVTLPQGGASLWVRAPGWVDAGELALVARQHGVLIEPGDVFYAQPPYPCPGFRLRLSSIAAARIGPGIEALGLAVDELAAARGEQRSAHEQAR